MSVVIKQVDEIEIFVNDNGGISIKQGDQFGGQESVVAFYATHIELIVKALRTAKKEISDGV